MKTEQGLFIGVDGTIKTREFAIGDSYELISDAVGGWIECAQIKEDIDLWLNEEGKLNGLEPNRLATILFWERYGVGSDIIVGDVFLASSNSEGDTIGLSDAQKKYLTEQWRLEA